MDYYQVKKFNKVVKELNQKRAYCSWVSKLTGWDNEKEVRTSWINLPRKKVIFYPHFGKWRGEDLMINYRSE